MLHDSVRLDPNNAVTHYILGFLFFHSGKFEDARKEYEQSIRAYELGRRTGSERFGLPFEILPDGSPYSGLASALLKQGKRDAARETVKQAIAHGVSKQDIYRELKVKTGSQL